MIERPRGVTASLRGVAYPATRRELLAMARENGAHDHVIERLRALPDREYGRPADVTGALQPD